MVVEGSSDEDTAHAVAQLGGGTDALTVVGMAYLQRGEIDAAARVFDAAVAVLGADPGSVAVSAHIGFVRLAQGSVDEARRLAAAVCDDARSSYLDRTYARLVIGLAAARRLDLAVLTSAFDAARAEVDATGDQLTQAFVRLAEGRALDYVDSERAADRTADAWARLEALGIDGIGWRTVFDQGLGLSTPVIEI
jgi:hypothetical protein